MKRTRINPISAKRRAGMAIYSDKRAKALEDHPTCQRCGAAQSTDIHHTAGRTGVNYLDTTTWRCICRRCHTWIHNHPRQAREQQWLK